MAVLDQQIFNMKLTKKQREEFADDKNITGFEVIYDKLTANSIDDGDANEHEVVIQNLNNKTFYQFFYDEWIGTSTEIEDIPDEMEEVKPKTVTITIYE